MSQPPSPFLPRREGACEIYLVRHADATPDASSPAAANFDDQPLNARGLEQAQALARALGHEGFTALYTSPLRRCLETIMPLSDEANLSISIEPDVREIRFDRQAPDLDRGQAQGRNGAGDLFHDGGMAVGAFAMRKGTFDGLPGAEPRAQFRARVRDAIDQLAADHPGERIAVCTHGGVVNVYVAVVLGLERDFFVPVANTAISVVRVRGTERIIVALNNISHLRSLPQ
ncbi:MAG: histidine phosphatase family protein [Chloroflexi bacterium]|nr:histidine phosphatase family protein [Chloroflexota bacterium]